MRVSEFYNLGRTQPTLSFVDVDIDGDTALFITPTAIESVVSDWNDECVFLVQDFFQFVLSLIKSGKNSEAETLLRVLKEPNETHLGVSVKESRGRALGNDSAHSLWEALSKSKASVTGLLSDLEDAALMIDGVSTDIVSDIATNIIRKPLIQYTQEMCKQYNIPMEEAVNSGPLWNHETKQWYSEFVKLPVNTAGKLLLVPKVIVRQRLDYNAQEYFTHYILTHMQQVELESNSALVQLLKNGTRRVTKKSLKLEYGTGKEVGVDYTLKHPEILAKYKREKEANKQQPLTHFDIAAVETTPVPNWDELLKAVVDLPSGIADAHSYEDNVEALLTALFYPSLTDPHPQHEIHEGRKRIDISYTNMACDGFFYWAGMHYPAPQIYIECKNYSRDLANNELDQLSSRFSPQRGRVGVIVCRDFDDKDLFLQRCKDTAQDERGWIIPLDDEDLKVLVESKKNDEFQLGNKLLKTRFDQLVN